MKLVLEFHLPNGDVLEVEDRSLSGETLNEYINRISQAQGFFITPTKAYRMYDLHLVTVAKE